MKKNLIVRWLGVSAVLALIAAASLFVLREPVPAHAVNSGSYFWLDCPVSEVTEGDSFVLGIGRVVVRRSLLQILNPADFSWHVFWSTEARTADSSDYTHLDRVQQASSGEENTINWMTRTFYTTDDDLIEGNETFRVSFDSNYSMQNQTCDITIVDNDPSVTGIEIVSEPDDGEAYDVGETIDIAVSFSTVVKARGDVLIGIFVGDVWRGAWYKSGSPSYTLIFGYEVQPGDLDDDGISVPPGYMDEDGRIHGIGGSGAIIQGFLETVVHYEFDGLNDQAGHKVYGRPATTGIEIISTPENSEYYRAGETIELAMTFNGPVEVEGHMIVGLRMGTGSWWRGARYLRGSGTDTLVFGYEVQPGDLDEDGVSMDGSYTDSDGVTHGFGGDGSITAVGTDVLASPHYPYLHHDPDHKVRGRIGGL
ncbi:MAG: hypothetical protein F4Z35_02560 [Dehalococcoidia bacterium]|nr:hypothetical protein [Dehalococcoidia bacterium]